MSSPSPVSRRQAFRTLLTRSDGSADRSAAILPLVAITVFLLASAIIFNGLSSLWIYGQWRWDARPIDIISLTAVVVLLALRPVRHRWIALAGGLLTYLVVSLAAQHLLGLPRIAWVAAGTLAGVAAFAIITRRPAATATMPSARL